MVSSHQTHTNTHAHTPKEVLFVKSMSKEIISGDALKGSTPAPFDSLMAHLQEWYHPQPY